VLLTEFLLPAFERHSERVYEMQRKSENYLYQPYGLSPNRHLEFSESKNFTNANATERSLLNEFTVNEKIHHLNVWAGNWTKL
jgi:hypothetical protein